MKGPTRGGHTGAVAAARAAARRAGTGCAGSRGLRLLLAMLGTLLVAGCWVYRGGANYEYEPLPAAHGWTVQPELRKYSVWRLERGSLRYTTDVWRYRHDMLALEVFNSGQQAERLRILPPEGTEKPPRVHAMVQDDSKSYREVVPGDAWIDVPPRASVRVTVMLAGLRGSSEARVGDRIRFRIEDSADADGGSVDFDFRLARIWRDYVLSPVIGD